MKCFDPSFISKLCFLLCSRYSFKKRCSIIIIISGALSVINSSCNVVLWMQTLEVCHIHV